MRIQKNKLQLIKNQIRVQLLIWKNGGVSFFSMPNNQIYNNLPTTQFLKTLTFELQDFSDNRQNYQDLLKQLITEKKRYLKYISVFQHLNVFKTSYLNLTEWSSPLAEKMAASLKKYMVKLDDKKKEQTYLQYRHVNLQRKMNLIEAHKKKELADKLERQFSIKAEQKAILICRQVEATLKYTQKECVAFLQAQQQKRKSQEIPKKDQNLTDSLKYMKKMDQQELGEVEQGGNVLPQEVAQQFQNLEMTSLDRIVSDIKIAIIISKELTNITIERFQQQVQRYQVFNSHASQSQISLRKNSLKSFKKYINFVLKPEGQTVCDKTQMDIYENTLQMLAESLSYIFRLFLQISHKVEVETANRFCDTLLDLYKVMSKIGNQILYKQLMFLMNKTVTQDDVVQISYLNEMLQSQETSKILKDSNNLKKAFFTQLQHFVKKSIRTKSRIHRGIQLKDIMGMAFMGTIKGIIQSKEENQMVFRSYLMLEKTQLNMRIYRTMKQILQAQRDYDSINSLANEREQDISDSIQVIKKNTYFQQKINKYVSDVRSQAKYQLLIHDLDSIVYNSDHRNSFQFTPQKINFLLSDFQSKLLRSSEQFIATYGPTTQQPESITIQEKTKLMAEKQLLICFANSVLYAILSNQITQILQGKDDNQLDVFQSISFVQEKCQEYKVQIETLNLVTSTAKVINDIWNGAQSIHVKTAFLERMNDIYQVLFEQYSIKASNHEIMILLQLNVTNIEVKKSQLETMVNKVLNANQNIKKLDPNIPKMKSSQQFSKKHQNECKIVQMLTNQLGRVLEPASANALRQYIDSRHQSFNQISFRQLLDKQELQTTKKLNVIKKMLGIPLKTMKGIKDEFTNIVNRVQSLLDKEKKLQDEQNLLQAEAFHKNDKLNIQKQFLDNVKAIREKGEPNKNEKIAQLLKEYEKKLQEKVSKLNQLNQQIERTKSKVSQTKLKKERQIEILQQERQFILQQMKKLKFPYQNEEQPKQLDDKRNLYEMSESELLSFQQQLTRSIMSNYDKLNNLDKTGASSQRIQQEIIKAKTYLQEVRRVMTSRNMLNTSKLAKDVIVSLQNMRVQFQTMKYSISHQRKQTIDWLYSEYSSIKTEVENIKTTLNEARKDGVGNQASIDIMLSVIDLLPETFETTLQHFQSLDLKKVEEMNAKITLQNQVYLNKILQRLKKQGRAYDQETNQIKSNHLESSA